MSFASFSAFCQVVLSEVHVQKVLDDLPLYRIIIVVIEVKVYILRKGEKH